MTSRLQSDDTSKESKWADIDDEDDWQPESTMEWTDGSKTTLPAPEEKVDIPEPLPVPEVKAIPKEIKPIVVAERRFSPIPSSRESAQNKVVVQAAPPVQEAPRPGPWAPIPAGATFPTPRPMMIQAYPLSTTRPQDPQRTPLALQPAKEVPSDDFSRSWRDKAPSQNRELFNSETGKLEPVQESSRSRMAKTKTADTSQRPSVLLQRPNSVTNVTNGPAEPSAAFQQQRMPHRPNDQEARRRRASSIVSASSAKERRLSLVKSQGSSGDMDGPFQNHNNTIIMGSLGNATEMTGSPVMGSLPSPKMNGEGVLSIEKAPVQEPVEDPIVVQQRVMKEAREAAKKRREEEDRLEEEAKQARLKKKLEQLGYSKDTEASSTPVIPTSVKNEVDSTKIAQASTVKISDPTEIPNGVAPSGQQQTVGKQPSDQALGAGDSSVVDVVVQSEKNTIEPWKSVSAGSKHWSGSNRATASNPWQPMEGEMKSRFPQLESLPFNSAEKKPFAVPSGNKGEIDEKQEGSSNQYNNSGASISQPVQPDSTGITTLKRSGYDKEHGQVPPHMRKVSPTQVQQDQQVVKPNNVSSTVNVMVPRERSNNYVNNSSVYPTTQDNHRNFPQNRNNRDNRDPRDTADRSIMRDPRGRPSNPPLKTMAGAQWQSASETLAKQEAAEREARKALRLEAEAREAAKASSGETTAVPTVAKLETTWRKIEVDKFGRRRVVDTIKPSVEKIQPIVSEATSAPVSDGTVQSNNVQVPLGEKPNAYNQPSVGVPMSLPEQEFVNAKHMQPSQPRSKFFPETSPNNQSLKHHTAAATGMVYPNTVEPLITSPPYPMIQALPGSGQANASPVVVTFPPQPQHGNYSPPITRRYHSPPRNSVHHQIKADGPTSPRSGHSSTSAFEKIQSRILGLVHRETTHSRENSADLNGSGVNLVDSPTILNSTELETTSKPAFDEFQAEKVTVSLPGSRRVTVDVSSEEAEEILNVDIIAAYEPCSKPCDMELLDELYVQDFASLPTVHIPSTIPKALYTPAQPPSVDHRKGSNKGRTKPQVLTYHDVMTVNKIFDDKRDNGKVTVVVVKLNANATKTEYFMSKSKGNDAGRKYSAGFKGGEGRGRGNYKNIREPLRPLNPGFVPLPQPPSYIQPQPMMLNPAGGYVPRRMVHSTPRKLTPAV